MQKFILFCILLIAGFAATAQKDNPHYNKTLADSLGADEYGMKMYVLVILKAGTNTINDKVKTDSLFRGHMDNIGRLVRSGKLIVAGPLEKNENKYEGIFILNVRTIEEAKLLTDTDPVIKAGLLHAELYSWYGSAALSMYLPFHERAGRKIF